MSDDNTPPANPPADPPANPPVPPAPPAPPTPPANPPANEDANSRLDRMEGILTTLTETVAKLLPTDDKPVKRPWTHAGSRRRNQE